MCLTPTDAKSALWRQPIPLRRQLRQGPPGRDGVGVIGAEDALADGDGAPGPRHPRQLEVTATAVDCAGPVTPVLAKTVRT